MNKVSGIPTVMSIKRTTDLFPRQWEGKLEDGRVFYVRYRYDVLSLQISPSPSDDIDDAVMATPVFNEYIGSNWGAELPDNVMEEILKPFLKFKKK